jgi:serine/threonine-protein kinase SRPK3
MGLFPKVNNIGLPIPVVMVVARQLLMALDFLHRDCHVIHTDLKPDNILVKLDNAETAILIREEEFPPIASIHMVPSELPSHAILSHPIRAFSSDELLNLIHLSQLHVQLTDFGTGESPI